MELRAEAQKYIDLRRPRFSAKDRATLENLFFTGREYSLMACYKEESISFEDLLFAMKDSVSAYPKDKDNAIEHYKKFLTFLSGRYSFPSFEGSFPPIKVSNTFERQMFIAKYLQDPEISIDGLQDILWTSSRTIEKDLARLRGNTEDPIQILGKRFIIPQTQRTMDTLKSSSTAHPLFLTGNLTEVLVTLKGLRAMSKESAYSLYAETMASSIWSQLSTYARKRIAFVSEHMLLEDIHWYEHLEEITSPSSFHSERDCSHSDGDKLLMMAMKNGSKGPFFIEYEDDEGTVRIARGSIRRFVEGVWEFETDNEGILFFKSENVLRSGLASEELV